MKQRKSQKSYEPSENHQVEEVLTTDQILEFQERDLWYCDA